MTTRRFRFVLAFLFIAPPAVSLGALPDRIPADSLIYVGWPGSERLGEAYKGTSAAKILAEPEMQQLRAKLLPAIDALIRQQMDGQEDEEKIYEQGKGLLEAIYKYPTGIVLVGVDASTVIPLVDAGIIVESGADSPSLKTALEGIFENAGMPMEQIKGVKVGEWQMRELAIMGPAMSLRWGVIDDCFVVTFGNKLLKHLVPGYLASKATADAADTQPSEKGDAPVNKPSAKNLSANPLFQKALEVTGGSPDLPLVFVNLHQVLATADAFQPMLAGFGIPVLGEPGGLRKVLSEIGAGDPQSFTVAWMPADGGLQSTMFLHAPGMKPSEPLAEADFKVIPQTASWASAGQMDLLAIYKTVLGVVQTISPPTHDEVMDIIGEIETRMGMKLGDDVLGSFGDTWVVFDDPQTGSLLFTGMTIVADVKPGNKIDEALRVLVQIIAEETGSNEQITVREEDHAGIKIRYMNFKGLPVPVAPAWAVHNNRCIIALYPQMVRITLDRMKDKQAKTLWDNEDFRRGWKLMPPKASSMYYVDAARGVRHLYSIGLPIAQLLMSLGQEEGFDLDASAMPSLPAITRHVFGSVSAGTISSEGYFVKAHGAIPGTLASLSQASVAGPLALSVALPSLANARQAAKRTVSMANLKGIGMAVVMYATEHDGKLPPDLQTLVKAGSITDKTLISPLNGEPGEEGSYIYVGAGLNTSMGGQLIVAYEKPENHGGYMTNVLFLDGHVEFTTRDRLDQLLEETKEQAEQADDGKAEQKEEGKDDSDTELRQQREQEEAEETGRSRVPAAKASPARRTPRAGDNESKLAQAMIDANGPMAMAIDTFRLEIGRYPNKLSELTTKPEDEDDARKWNGPYIKNAESLKDPWGRPFKYLAPGEANEAFYDLWSVGPDGKSGTDDDLKNW